MQEGVSTVTKAMASDGGDPTPRRWSRRTLLKSAGIGTIGVVAGSGVAGAETYEDRSAERVRGLAASQDRAQRSSVRTLWRANTTEKVIALSFDDGPGEPLTTPLLDLLRDAHVPATFAVVGVRAQRRPDLIRRQLEEGHELVNHSWSHPDLSLLGPAAVAREIDRTNALLHEVAGIRPAFVRPPFGRINGALLEHLGATGQDLLMWHMRFAEERFNATGLARNVVSDLAPGMIVLAHDYGKARRAIGIAAVPHIIEGARAKGYRFVTASQLLALDAPKAGQGRPRRFNSFLSA